MLQLTLHVPKECADAVYRVLCDNAYVVNIVRMRDACTRPAGDALLAAVPREAASNLLDELAAAGLTQQSGSVTIDERRTVLSDAADEAARQAQGAPGDALLWPVVRATTGLASEMSVTYYVFMVLATAMVTIGLMTSSAVLIIGGMILGPEFGALAHICVGVMHRDWREVIRANWLLFTGFFAGITLSALMVVLLDVTDRYNPATIDHAFELTIVSPSFLGFVVALFAGSAGVLTLTSSKGEALIGVLVSVATIPAASDMALGIALADMGRLVNGFATLMLNLLGMVLAGAVTLAVHWAGTQRRIRKEIAARATAA